MAAKWVARVITIGQPGTPGEWLLVAELALAWVLVSYVLLGNEPILVGTGRQAGANLPDSWPRMARWRGILMLALTVALARPLSGAAAALALLLGIAAWGLPQGRYRLATRPPEFAGRKRAVVAEFELGVAALVMMSIVIVTAGAGLAPREFVHLPLSERHLSIVIAVIAGLLFVGPAGTHIVRGVLDKAQALPPKSSPADDAEAEEPEAGDAGLVTSTGQPVDKEEYRRGRIIGTVERLLLVAVVAVGHFEALAFLVAAKGLIRANDLKERGFAEYFLIGTLTSTLLAVAVGLGIQALAKRW